MSEKTISKRGGKPVVFANDNGNGNSRKSVVIKLDSRSNEFLKQIKDNNMKGRFLQIVISDAIARFKEQNDPFSSVWRKLLFNEDDMIPAVASPVASLPVTVPATAPVIAPEPSRPPAAKPVEGGARETIAEITPQPVYQETSTNEYGGNLG
jgi:hypothetical protein